MSILDRFSLKGKTAIVTGSGQGIGKAIATAFAEAGANVVLAGIDMRDPENSKPQLEGVGRELERLGARTICAVTDMRKRTDIEAMLGKAVQAFGGVDVLVNNAGGGTMAPFLEMREEEFETIVRENLTTTFLGCSVVGAHMAKRGSGAIVNFSSMSARGPAPQSVHYGAAKAGIISLTHTVAAELASYGVRCNAIAPFLIRTELVGAALDSRPGMEEEASAKAALGRTGRPDEIAAAALFLVSDASSYITGETLNVAGGAQPGSHVKTAAKAEKK